MKSRKEIYEYLFSGLMIIFSFTVLADPEIPLIKFAFQYLVHFMFGFLILGMVFMVFGQNKLMFTSLGVSAVLCVFLKNQSQTSLTHENRAFNNISVAHINLGNIQSADEISYIMNQSTIDIFSFQEFTPDWVEVLDSIMHKDFKFNTKLTRLDPFGKAIYSKFPIQNIDTLTSNNIQDLLVSISNKEFSLNFISTYINPPLDKNATKIAEEQLELISKKISYFPTIVAGEFNMVYWHPKIREFRNRNNLNNTRKEILPYLKKVPSDHIFFTKNLHYRFLNQLLNKEKAVVGLTAGF